MYDTYQKEFVPVPDNRQETGEEKKWTHFHEQEVVFVKGMSFRVQEIAPRKLTLVPIE
jgi:hypothetical protein